jgi:hypothetical protein
MHLRGGFQPRTQPCDLLVKPDKRRINRIARNFANAAVVYSIVKASEEMR